jgi:quercetin dioxygenase-like cupin family protein
MKRTLALALALACAPLAANARGSTPPGTCAIVYPAQPIPGDAAHQAFALHMDIAPGRTANMHFHTAAEYMSVNSGTGWLEVAGKRRINLVAGHVYMIAPNTMHRAHNTGASHLTWTGFFVGKAGEKTHTTLKTSNMKMWTPGCATHF